MENASLIGGTGFVGYHFKKVLNNRYNVVATGRDEDIRDVTIIKSLVKRVNPNIVINLAAITTVHESFERQLDTYNIGFFFSSVKGEIK